MLESIALMNGITEKMGYLQTRQRVLSQNITNADTPGYAAHDVSKPDFRKSMSRFMGYQPLASGEKLTVNTTNSAHAAHLKHIDRATTGDRMRKTYEITPTKNTVSIEEQMMNASQTAIDYQLATNLYNKNVDMIRSAIRSN